MNFKTILVPLGGVLLALLAFRSYGLAGLLAALGAVVMWGLLHYTRLMQILKRAANSPVGYVGSAVMLNAKLSPGLPLIHVLALTRSLGELRSPKDQQPEVFRWTDGTQSHVTLEFKNGKLQTWVLHRPPGEADQVLSSP
jgi:hypothetical protein